MVCGAFGGEVFDIGNRFAGSVALFRGGNSGIDEATAFGFAEQTVQVVIAAPQVSR